MQHVRVDRAIQVPVPPVSATPFLISQETKQQLCVTRHRAFERHQENAQWAKLLLGSDKIQSDTTPSGQPRSQEELQMKIEATVKATEELQRRLVHQKAEAHEAQRRFEYILATLKDAGDAVTFAECEKTVGVEKRLLPSKEQRTMEIVRL
ncbi:hypothetical protein CCR75_003063 [Bremia lactucae]|uniref:Uncharacterized protein n=1 Tax=Bremia lactucae TaxID=4779 RepID=A0A976IMB6_BRELC|nr:hypothetical protein CCR75_003063 [Bremia lactucae]